MRLHLQICILCRRYGQQLTLIRSALRKGNGQLHEDSPTDRPGLSPEAKARIRRALDSRPP
jgi:hypothetical protein